MKALMKKSPSIGDLELVEVSEPSLCSNQVKIKVMYTGICGSDIHTYKGEYNNANLPLVLGHEFSGQVVEVGDHVSRIKVGDLVTSETTFSTCGKCTYCLTKNYNLCDNRKGIGTQISGSMSEFVVTREESCHRLPDNVNLRAGALTEPLACCVHAAFEKTTIQNDDYVLVIGPGPIGLLMTQVIKSAGAKVILTGIDQDKDRLSLGFELGADIVVNTSQENLEEIIFSNTVYGVDKVFDCSGSIYAVNEALPLLKKKGIFIQVGLFAQKYNNLDLESIIQRELIYIGSRSQKPSSWIKALKLLSDRAIDVDKIVTQVYDLKDWDKAFKSVLSGNECKVLIQSNHQ
ncbi:zinc-binding dehydrogenase [Vagococcus luciliae]|uniref:D-arabitol-phosphate dehydrogenase n=1 Tax=Vagococcus luciliae TaxID=2920380 RepID=A0ABY5NYS9_9ENTE|nr:zinc-binding dehydrogenase [Vagococcus luciliae]UUV98586.1 D-arabitol-phosphate dehydrogenase [Vagococcus luciliae]